MIYDDSTMEYIEALGRINERLAAEADEVVEVIAGIPQRIKPGSPGAKHRTGRTAGDRKETDMRIIKSFFIAFSMYSKIPMPQFQWKDEDMRYALCFFHGWVR